MGLSGKGQLKYTRIKVFELTSPIAKAVAEVLQQSASAPAGAAEFDRSVAKTPSPR
jgi:hypothetical protein